MNKQRIYDYLSYLLILLALIIGFGIRFFSLIRYTTFDIGPAPDQVRDAFIYMKMWQGQWVTLGPSASIGGYSLPPLYYYLVFPFTILGAAPVFQVLPNTLFSFLSIPLLMLLVYELLEFISPSFRRLLSGLSGLWYSVLFGEIFISTFQWNPSPIPFFLISCVLIYKYLLENKFNSIVVNSLLWLIYGCFIAILTSLHSTAMFVMPLVFIISLIFYNYKQRKNVNKCALSSLSILAAFISLFPYLQGEISRNFANTKKILSLLRSESHVSQASIIDKLKNILVNYFELGQQLYFPGYLWIYLIASILLLSLILYGVILFKGNLTIRMFLGLSWLIYLYAAANFQGIFFIHYKMLFIISPIIFAILTLAYIDYNQPSNIAIASIIVLGIICSITLNFRLDFQYLSSKYSSQRVLATSDIVRIFETIPSSNTICEPKYKGSRLKLNPYNYIDEFITKRKFNFVNVCKSGNYTIHPKYKMQQNIDKLWPLFTIKQNSIDTQNLSLVYDFDVANIYVNK